MEMETPDLCLLIKIMISSPPSSGWVERFMVCQNRFAKSRKTINFDNLFVIGYSEAAPKDCVDYIDDIQKF